MRRVILGSATAAYAGETSGVLNEGALKFVAFDTDGTVKKVVASGASTGEINAASAKVLNLLVGRPSDKGGVISAPVAKDRFSYTKKTYTAGVAGVWTVTFTNVTITPGDEYTVMVVKNGLKFNERNKWSWVRRASATDTAATLAADFALFVNANKEKLELSASVSNAVVTLTATNKGEYFTIKPTDSAASAVVANTTAVVVPEADINEVMDCLSKASADEGFRDTYQVANLYPMQRQNPFAITSFTDYGFTIYTLDFIEHREVKTMDDGVKQILQVIIPNQDATTAGVQCQAFEAILAAL